MKVEKIEVFLTAAVWRNFLFVKLTTDDGVVGWGDGTLEWKESTVRDLILDLGRRYVVGHDPFDIESLWFQFYEKLIARHPENRDAKLNMFKSGWEQLMCK